ncbi:hypothetical protein ABNF65_22540 [Paenibacillus larvae]
MGSKQTKFKSTRTFDSNTQISTYSDGSITVQSIDLPRNLLEGGTATGGSGYRIYSGVKVSHSNINMSANFYADYVIVSGGPSYISNVYTLSVGVVGGTHSDKSLVLRKEREDFRGPAEAVLQFKVTFYGSSASGDYWVKLNVGGGKLSVGSTQFPRLIAPQQQINP